ncbi:MAG: hypothetical protein ACR2MY_04470, partial [Candidatus Dormibacteria bacterium]
KAYAPGQLASNGQWSFDLSSLAQKWLQGQNTGAAIVPVTPAAGTVPDPTTNQTYEISFAKAKSSAEGTFSSGSQSNPQNIPQNAPVSTGVFNAPIVTAAAPPSVSDQVIPPLPAAPAQLASPAPVAPKHAPVNSGHTPRSGPAQKTANNWVFVAGAAVLALFGLLAIGTVQQMARTGVSGLNFSQVAGALTASRSHLASPLAMVALTGVIAVGYTGQASALPGFLGGNPDTTAGAVADVSPNADNGATPAQGTGSGGTGGTGGTGAAGSGGAAAIAAGSAGSQKPGLGAYGTGRTVAGDAPGVTATTVKIGFFNTTNANALNKAAGFNTVNATGDQTVEANAIVKYINAHGGLANHQVQAVFETIDAASTDPTQAEKLCTAFTEQDHVFAVVNAALNQSESASACYAQHHTLMLDNELFHEDDTFYRQLYPYLWTPSHLNSARMAEANIDGLQAQGYFAPGIKLGVLYIGGPVGDRIYNDDFVPRLAHYGVQVTDHHSLDPNADTQSNQAALNNAVVSFETKGVNRVMFATDSGGSIAVSFMLQSKSQTYHPIYGLSSYDAPQAIAATGAVPDQLANAKASGYAMFLDVNDADGAPWPTGPQETLCNKIMADGGQSFTSRTSAGLSALPLCDGMFLLQQATQGLGANLTIQGFAQGVNGLGSSFKAAVPYATTIDGRHQDLASAYRTTAYESSCGCWRYRSAAARAPD